LEVNYDIYTTVKYITR